MAAGGQEQQVGKGEPVGEPRGQRMRFQVVDRQQRLSCHQRQGLGGDEADQHPADQAGTGGHGDAVHVREREARAVQRPGDQPVEHFHMGPGRDLRHHAAIGRVLGDLAQHLVRQDDAAAVLARRHDGGGGLVAGGLDTQHVHGDD